MIHHSRVNAKKIAPTMSTSRCIGRKRASRIACCLASGESLSSAPSSRSGSRIEPHLALRVASRIGSGEGQTHQIARLQPEGSGGVALVYGEAKAPVGIRD